MRPIIPKCNRIIFSQCNDHHTIYDDRMLKRCTAYNYILYVCSKIYISAVQ